MDVSSWGALRRAPFAFILACLALLVAAPTAFGAQTVVSLTFDDGLVDQYAVRSILGAHGMRGTFYINSDDIGVPGRMDWNDLHDIAVDGNEIAGHTLHHVDLTTVSSTEATHQVCDDRQRLLTFGFSPIDFAYPYGERNASVIQIVKNCGYSSARRSWGLRSPGGPVEYAYSETIPPVDAYQIRTPDSIQQTTSLATIQNYVTQAETHGGGWVPLVFHHVCEGCDRYSITPANLNAFLDWLQFRTASGTFVKPVRDVIAPAATANLSVTKTDSPDPVQVGANLTYTMKVHNAGPNSASAVTLGDTLPAGLTLVSASTTQGSCTGTTTINCTLGTVASGNGGDVTATIVATAGPDAAPSVTNTATVSSSTLDPTPGNNEATASTTVTPVADLRLSKTDSPDPVPAGADLTYTVTVHNVGPSPASDVIVSDTLPAGVDFVSATPSQGTCSGEATVSCELGTVAAGTANDGTVAIVVRPNAGAGTSMTNTASVTSSTFDPSPGNNTASAPTGVTPSAGLSVTKTDSPDPVLIDADVTYTLTIHNAGPSAAAGVSVSDPLPAGLTLVSVDTTQGSCSGTGTVTCNIGTVAAGVVGDVTVTIIATAGPDAAPSVTNTATVSSTTADPSAADNEASADTAVVQQSYVRPRGATPFRVPLVPAFSACEDATTVHGEPLASGSCGPPAQVSQALTIGTPDANGAAANANGSLLMEVITGSTSTPEDEADVALGVSLTDVRNAGDLSDYAGELLAHATIRLTDKLSGAGQNEPGTVNDFELEVAVPCAPTPSPNSGATCSVSTTADALTSGMVSESARSVWQVERVAVDDGGPDGVASTPGNELFEVQGVFVP
jgi:uncharacterized repeat protein (TIGR01451 family)